MKVRTNLQNKSLHLFCEQLATALNDAGIDMKLFIEMFDYQMDIDWTKESVKEVLWRPIQKAMLGKESTTEIDTVEPSVIHKQLMARISEVTGVYVPWPDRFNR